ncbi:IPT/TIG domain-containing protein [Paraflavitalea sp. CAU 1676]|uniref:IPT/TIG domain-containing protein n=1 Tax=Paraflavitalea sp. CAU 1676 TaxID=3032598 RepID=UPI0023DB582B|nr:IPT/TIG domain-containing protein [Paraflavitalea sp. CAU 1676]MDF2188886.1 IPT/TIG domain-containing protein [Paraflavitalea sp. CAU 1676]
MKKGPSLLYAAGVSLALAAIFVAGCHKKDSPAEPAEKVPEFTSFSPAQAAEGATVVLSGKNFPADKSKSEVKFNGKLAVVSEAKATELSVTVPEDATDGRITIRIGERTFTSATDFKVNATAPGISAISPEKGGTDTEVIITGTRFAASSKVFFGGVEATAVTFVSKTSLKAKVPAAALNGKIKVTVGELEAVSAGDFWVKPSITSFTPSRHVEGATMTINGSNFSEDKTKNAVWFGDTKVTALEEATRTSIKVKIPGFIGQVKIAVEVKDSVQSAAQFTIVPTLSTFVTDGDPGATMTISGKNISNSATLTLGGSAVPIEADRTSTMIRFKVPANLNSGELMLTQDGLGNSMGLFEITNKWQAITTARSGSLSQTVSFVYDNKIYVAFGSGSGTLSARNLHIFDPASRAWTIGPALPATVGDRSLAACFMLNNKAYIGMGNYSPDRMDWWEYDPAVSGDGAWKQQGNFPVKGYGGINFAINGKGYAAYFYFGSGMNEFNPATGNWTQVLPASAAVDSHIYGAFFTLNNKAYFGCGQRSDFVVSTKMYVFDPANTALGMKELTGVTWPAGNVYSRGFSTFTMEGKAYFIGSDQKTYVFDPAAPAWTHKTTVPETITENSAAVINGAAYCWSPSGVVYRYVPSR